MSSELLYIGDAIRLYESGKIDEAENVCRRALKARPSDANVLQLLGAIAFRRQNYEEAENIVRQAIAFNMHAAEYHNDL